MCAAIFRPVKSRRRVSAAQRGVTLVELIVAIVIISVGVASILSTFNIAVRGSASPLIAKQSLAIAEALMEEVQLAPFTFCDPDDPLAETAAAPALCGVPEAIGPEAGDARPFDNVSDYHGYGLPVITDLAGVAVPYLAGYTAAITVAATALNGIAAASGDAFLITVTVTAPTGEVFALEGYRTRYAPNALP